MNLAPGTRIGPYEIVSMVGSGGMGEVYRARDPKLQRDVALKTLPEVFASDPERLARFEREARTLAALNHPHIAGIHGFEENNGVRALALEFVEGETLADRISRGAIPFDDALPIAREIAEALEAAHEQGVIHRDLKPANIKITPEGAVKVLDFGLAKLLDAPGAAPPSPSPSVSPTITSPALMTQAGTLLGTAAYMAPEQAKGRPADKRSDVWAFGCVLYEMLSGRTAFGGDDVADVLAAVLRAEPEWNALPRAVPASVRQLLQRCLMKDRRSRINDAGVLRYVLNEPTATTVGTAAAPAQIAAFRWRRIGAIVATAAVFTSVGGYVAWTLRPAPTRDVVRYTIPLRPGTQFTGTGRHIVAISPNGRHVAFVANNEVYVRPIDSFNATPIPTTRGAGNAAGRNPFFSPDSQWIGFWQEGQLKRVPTAGGAVIRICDAPNPSGVSWGADGSIVFSEGSTGIWRVAAEGGEPERIVEIPASQTAHGPQLLPDGRRVLFTLAPADDWDRAQIVTQVLGTGERTVLISTGRDGRYLPGGYLLYVEGTTLFAARFDPTTLSVGTTVPVVEDVGRVVNRLSMAAQFSVSASGTLVYAAAIEGRTSSLVWFSRSGRSEPLKAMPPRAYYGARLSPDGGRIAMEIQDENREIWTWDVAAEKLERKTFDPAWDGAPLWSHDGRHLFFTSDRAGGPFRLFWQMADGTGKAEPLSTDPAADPTAVSPDGERLIFQEFVRSNADIMELSLSGVRARRPLIRTAATERNATVSPDGRWLAYESNSSGRPEIYVKPYPNVESGIWQVSLGGGQQPRWSRKGDELFYINPAAGSSTAFMSVKVTGVNTWAHDSPVKLFDTDYPFPIGSTGRTEYDVAPDQRFLLLKPVPSSDVAPQALSIVVNWTEDLRRLVPQR